MRALTLWQPWAHAVAHLGKPIENRDWPPPAWIIGKRLAIHAGKTLDRDACELIEDTFDVKVPAELPLGAVVAVVTVTCSIEENEYLDRALASCFGAAAEDKLRWFSGPHGWVLTDVVTLPTPIPCRGAQGLWNLPADVEDLVLGQLDLVRRAVTSTAAASR